MAAVSMAGMTMVRITDGRLVESWVKNDVMGLIEQLGGSRDEGAKHS